MSWHGIVFGIIGAFMYSLLGLACSTDKKDFLYVIFMPLAVIGVIGSLVMCFWGISSL